MTYSWAYLCSNPWRLSLTLRLLPKEPLVGLGTMQICWASHLDQVELPNRLIEVLKVHAPAWLHWQLVDLSMLHDELPDGLRAYWNTGKNRWSLGMKLLIPFAIAPPYLYTDDDVIIGRDPWSLLENSSGFGSKGCFRFPANKHSIARQLFTAFDLVGPGWDDTVQADNEIGYAARDVYNTHALDAGVWFHRYPDDWRERLERFAELPYLRELTTRNLELRCLDQRFLTCFGLKHGWDAITIGNGFAPPARVSERMLTRHPFFHYKSQSKATWMTRLEDFVCSRTQANTND